MSLSSFATATTSISSSADNDDSPIASSQAYTFAPSTLENDKLSPPPTARSGAPSPIIHAHRGRPIRDVKYPDLSSPYGSSRKLPTRYENAHHHAPPPPPPAFSVVSVSPTPPSPRPPPRSESGKTDFYADLEWTISPQNSRNWSRGKKGLHFALICTVTAIVSFGATISVPFTSSPSTVETLPLSLYLLGLAFGPILSGIKILGRKGMYMLSLALYAIFILAAGLLEEKSIAGMVVMRFLAGFSGSPAAFLGFVVVGELFDENERVLPMVGFVASGALGSTLGPVVGGVVRERKGWAWTQFVVLFALAGVLVPVLVMNETEKRNILRKKTRVRVLGAEEFGRVMREKIVLMYCVVVGYISGVWYALFAVFPPLLGRKEGFGMALQGVCFVGMSVGVLIGMALLLCYEIWIYRPRARRYKETHHVSLVEEKVSHSRRSSRSKRLSFGPSHEQLLLNTAGTPDGRKRRRNSLLLQLRRLSLGHSYRHLEAPEQDPQKNIALAVAAARYLNGLEPNESKKITPEQALLLLNQNSNFNTFCLTLESHNLAFSRQELANSLLQQEEPDDDLAIAALEKRFTPTAAPFPVIPTGDTRSKPLQKASRPSHLPPAEWRLHPALPSAFLLPGSLFFLAWTTKAEVHWIAPVIALGLFALSALLTYVSLTLYVFEIHGTAGVAAGTVVSGLAGFAFSLFAGPMFETLAAGWGGSVFGFVGIGIVVLGTGVLFFFGRRWRERI